MNNIVPFLNYLQELYNSLAVLFMEYENNQKGIGYAEKAEQLYHLIKNMGFSEEKHSSNLSRLFAVKQRLNE